MSSESNVKVISILDNFISSPEGLAAQAIGGYYFDYTETEVVIRKEFQHLGYFDTWIGSIESCEKAMKAFGFSSALNPLEVYTTARCRHLELFDGIKVFTNIFAKNIKGYKLEERPTYYDKVLISPKITKKIAEVRCYLTPKDSNNLYTNFAYQYGEDSFDLDQATLKTITKKALHWNFLSKLGSNYDRLVLDELPFSIDFLVYNPNAEDRPDVPFINRISNTLAMQPLEIHHPIALGYYGPSSYDAQLQWIKWMIKSQDKWKQYWLDHKHPKEEQND